VSRKEHTQLVADFMKAFGQPVSQGWNRPPTVILGMNLIEEEFMELTEAAESLIKAHYAPKDCDHNLIREHFVKELADLAFVVFWLAAGMGINLDEAIREVWASNMSKLGEDGKPIYREDGKVLKGPNYRMPDLSQVVRFTPITL